MFDSLITASMNDICLHTQTGSSSLHLCFISTLHTGAGQSASAVVDTMEPSTKRPRSDSPAGKAQETAAAQKTTAAPTQDPPPLDPKAYSTVSKAGAQSAIFDTTAACKHDEGKWKEAMKECAGWWKAERNLLLLIALQTWKFCERSKKLVEEAMSFDFGWGDMDRASHQCPNNVKLQGNKPTVTVTKEDALKRAWEAAGKPGSVVGVLRMTKEYQCNKYMQQQRGDRNQDGELFRRTDLLRFVYGAGNQEIGAKSCRVHMDMSIFRDTEAAGYAFLDTPRKVHAIASAAMNKPPVADDKYDNLEDRALMQSKLLVILAAADIMNINHLVLTAFGCGPSCQNPPQVVAEMMLDAIKTYPIPTIDICVLDDAGSSNFEAFSKCFKTLEGS